MMTTPEEKQQYLRMMQDRQNFQQQLAIQQKQQQRQIQNVASDSNGSFPFGK
jgi:hypothetical protein